MIRRAWYATTPEGPSMDRFANAIAARVGNEIEEPFGVSVELVDNWLEIADRMYTEAGEPMGSDVDAAAESVDLTGFYEYIVDDEDDDVE